MDCRRWVVGQVEVWEYEREARIQQFEKHPGPVLGVSFSPDGLRVATSSNDTGEGVVKVWEIPSGREALSFKDPSGLIERVTFSPDGRRLATSGWNGTVTLWDVRTGRDVLCLRGHSDRVWGVNFSPSGDALVSAKPRTERSCSGRRAIPDTPPAPNDSGSTLFHGLQPTIP